MAVKPELPLGGKSIDAVISVPVLSSIRPSTQASSSAHIPPTRSKVRDSPIVVPKRVSVDQFVPIPLVQNGGDALPASVSEQVASVSNDSNVVHTSPRSTFESVSVYTNLANVCSEISPLVSPNNHFSDDFSVAKGPTTTVTYSHEETPNCSSDCPKAFRRMGLDEAFMQTFPNRESLANVSDFELPSIPSCPGTYYKSHSKPLVRPDATREFCLSCPTQALIYKTVQAYGSPNYLGARVPVSNFPINRWKERLVGYEDQELLDFLAFGWPIGYEGDGTPTLNLGNHPSANNFGPHVDHYISKELSFGALSGPFKDNPFDWLRLNPCMTRPKKDSELRRVILDLSFPLGHSVNSEIDKRVYEGGPYKLRLPTPLALAEHIARRGENCLLFKVDLARAYRQLPSDPWDWPLLGLSWNNDLFFDNAIPFGVRHGAMACQRTTEALCYAETCDNDNEAEAYIDDMAEVCGPCLEEATGFYNQFLDTTRDLGLNVSLNKCVGPSIELTWIGATFNSKKMIMFIDKSKVEETLSICVELKDQSNISKKALRSILGKLHHASKLCPPAKRFMNRLLQLLRNMGHKSNTIISKGAYCDLSWFIKFLSRYNCKAIIRPFQIFSKILEVDACLIGGGGVCEDIGYFFYPFPECFQITGLHIAELECFNILVGIRLLVDQFKGRSVRVNCDNLVSVLALQSGKTRDRFLSCVMRDIWFICALNDINLVVFHKPGAELTTPDLLSRGFKSEKDWIKLCEFRKTTKLKFLPVSLEHLSFPSDNDLNSTIIDDL